MITPSATLPTSAACSGEPIPNPTATGTGGGLLDLGDEGRELRRQLGPLARGADVGDDVDESARRLADLPATIIRRGRRHQRDAGQAGFGKRRTDLIGFAEGQVGDDHPGGARRGGPAGELLGAPRQDHVRVDHQHDRDPARRRSSRSRAPIPGSPRRPAPRSPRRGSPARRRAGPRRGRPARSGRPRNPRRRRRSPPSPRHRGSRPSCRASGQRGPARGPRRRPRRSPQPPPRSETSARSLSPRPERQSTSNSARVLCPRSRPGSPAARRSRGRAPGPG